MTKKRMNIYSIKDQMEKYGISEEEAIEKIKKIKNVNVFSIEWQMKKFNISREEAIEKINSIKNKLKEAQNNMTDFDFNSMIPSKKEHWIKKGFSEEESEKMASENIKLATKNCNVFIKKVKENPEKYKDVMTTQIGFYLKQGYDEIESKKLLSNRQKTFSLETCVDKYGIEEGKSVWKKRQEKWKKSIEGKITKEMNDACSLKYFLKKYKGNIEIATSEFEKSFLKRYNSSKIGKASKSSMKLFKHLIDWCERKELDYFCGVDNRREYYITDKDSGKIYAYDFTIPEKKLIFEYHGKFWHTKKESNHVNELGYSLSDSYKKDQIKKVVASNNGFELIEIFEEDGFEFNFEKMFRALENYQL
jgi:hypothetical protein